MFFFSAMIHSSQNYRKQKCTVTSNLIFGVGTSYFRETFLAYSIPQIKDCLQPSLFNCFHFHIIGTQIENLKLSVIQYKHNSVLVLTLEGEQTGAIQILKK